MASLLEHPAPQPRQPREGRSQQPARPRPPRPARPHRPSARTQALVGLAAAVRAAFASLLPLAVVVLVGWAGGGGGSTVAEAVRVTAWAWLLGHGTDLDLAQGSLALAPLGLAVLPLLALVVAATQAVRASGARTVRQALPCAASLLVTYAVLAVLVALATRTSQVRPDLVSAALGASALSLVALAVATVRALRRRAGALPPMPARPGLVLAGAVAVLATLLAGGGLLVAGSLAVHLPAAAASAEALEAGPLGGVLLLGLQALLVPNAVVWAASYAVGPGFAVGAGTTVAPSGVVLGPLPELPLLMGLPDAGAAPTASLLVLLAPVLAGVAGGLVVARRVPRGTSADRAAAYAALAGLCAALGLGVLCALSAGAAGGQQLATVGPAVLPVTMAAAAELGLVAAAAAWLRVHLELQRAQPGPRRQPDPHSGPLAQPDLESDLHSDGPQVHPEQESTTAPVVDLVKRPAEA